MTPDSSQLKQTLRGEARKLLAGLSAPERRQASDAICERVRKHQLWEGAGPVVLFSPLPDEPDIWPLVEEALAAGRKVGLPRFDSALSSYVVCEIRDAVKDLRVGAFKIREPRDSCPVLKLAECAVIFVPGVAFDREGYRLGRGRGYYDRLLEDVQSARICGVAFVEQLVDAVPALAHDVRMEFIATPVGVWRWETNKSQRGNLGDR